MFVFTSISSSGVKIEIRIKQTKVTTWPTYTSPEDVRRFQGFVGHYRRYIKKCNQISRPLTDFMPNPTGKGERNGENGTGENIR